LRLFEVYELVVGEKPDVVDSNISACDIPSGITDLCNYLTVLLKRGVFTKHNRLVAAYLICRFLDLKGMFIKDDIIYEFTESEHSDISIEFGQMINYKATKPGVIYGEDTINIHNKLFMRYRVQRKL
jgi:hypothetical protein